MKLNAGKEKEQDINKSVFEDVGLFFLVKMSFDKNNAKERRQQSQMQQDAIKLMQQKMKHIHKLGGTVSLLVMVTEVGENKIVYAPDTLHSPEVISLTSKIFESSFELMRQHQSNERSLESYQGTVKEFTTFEVVYHILSIMDNVAPTDIIIKQCMYQASLIENSFSNESVSTWAITISENNSKYCL